MNRVSTGQLSLQFDDSTMATVRSALATTLQYSISLSSSGTIPPATTPAHLDAWQDVFRRIHRFAELEPGWDSYGGVSPKLATCSRAIALAAAWREIARQEGGELPEPCASPCGNGSVQIEWTVGRRRLEIVVPNDPRQPYEWVAVLNGPSGARFVEGELYKMDDPQAFQNLRWLITEK